MDPDKLSQLLVHTDWDTILNNDIDTATTAFTHRLLAAAAEAIPIKTMKINLHNKTWVNADLRREIRKRDRLFRLAKKHRTDYHWDNWRQQRNLTTNMNKQLKDSYLKKKQVKTLLQTKRNPHEYHRILKQMLGRPKTTPIPPLVGPDGTPLTDDSDKAELLADFFAQQSQLDTDDLPIPETASARLPPILDNIVVLEEEVFSELNSIDPSKSNGSDNLPSKLLKMSAIIIKTPLTKLFNMSLTQGILPTS